MRRIVMSSCFAVLATIAFASQASASQFTFLVPVHVANAPAVFSLSVSCSVSDYKNNTLATANKLLTPLVNHGYDGTATIAFDVAPGIDPATAAKYDCSLTVDLIDKGGKVETTGDGALAADYLKITGQQATAATGSVYGTIAH
jgi:hypothetical protein